MDNNAAEGSIRGFCIGKHNGHLIDTIDGAKASAIIYSIAETAKANNLNLIIIWNCFLQNFQSTWKILTLDFLKIFLRGLKTSC